MDASAQHPVLDRRSRPQRNGQGPFFSLVKATGGRMRRGAKFWRDLVDLVGIEPTTSSMPWNWRNRKLLTDKMVKIDGVGRNRQNRHGLTPN
jgi:hypothetical protein